MITDYSSIAFDAGYLNRSVVYFQFDADRIFNGGHIGVHSYYEYARTASGR